MRSFRRPWAALVWLILAIRRFSIGVCAADSVGVASASAAAHTSRAMSVFTGPGMRETVPDKCRQFVGKALGMSELGDLTGY